MSGRSSIVWPVVPGSTTECILLHGSEAADQGKRSFKLPLLLGPDVQLVPIESAEEVALRMGYVDTVRWLARRPGLILHGIDAKKESTIGHFDALISTHFPKDMKQSSFTIIVMMRDHPLFPDQLNLICPGGEDIFRIGGALGALPKAPLLKQLALFWIGPLRRSLRKFEKPHVLEAFEKQLRRIPLLWRAMKADRTLMHNHEAAETILGRAPCGVCLEGSSAMSCLYCSFETCQLCTSRLENCPQCRTPFHTCQGHRGVPWR